MAGAIEVGRHIEAVRKAAAEFFLEGYEVTESVLKIIEQTSPEHRAKVRASLCSSRSLPDGCYRWIVYLLWLERMLEVASFTLYAVEAEGLVVVKQERNRFAATHPPCPYCGMPNEALALNCRECMAEIGRK